MKVATSCIVAETDTFLFSDTSLTLTFAKRNTQVYTVPLTASSNADYVTIQNSHICSF